MTRALRAAGIIVTIAGCAHHARPSGPQPEGIEGQGGLVTAVAFRGVRHVDLDELIAGLATKPSKCRSFLYAPMCLITRSPVFTERRYLDPLEFRRDALRIRILYWRRGYRDATVTARTERTNYGVRAIFDVDEKQPTVMETLELQQTDTVLNNRAVARAMQVRAGEPLDLVAVDSSIALLRDELWQRGYADAQIELDTTRVSDALNKGPVAIVVNPGPRTKVRAIEIEGNRKVSDRTVRRLLIFRVGDLFRRNDVLESQRNLYLSGLFSEVEMKTPPPGDSQKVVQVRVNESDLNRLDLTTGFTDADFFQLDAQFTRYNLIGSARRLTLRATLSNLLAVQLNGSGIFYDVTNGADPKTHDLFLRPTWSASIEMAQPWFLSPRNQLGVSVFSHRRSVPGIVIDHGSGATLSFTHEFAARRNSTLGYTYEATSVEASDVYFCVSFGVCDPATIRVIGKRNPLSPFSWVTQVDYTNDPFAPNQGYKWRVDLEHASAATGSDYQFNRAALTTSKYWRTTKWTVLAGRIRLGWVRAMSGTNDALNITAQNGNLIVHPRKRFYSGGSQSVRGFAENQLGPRVLTISPASLTNPTLANHCTAASIQDLTCDPNIAKLSASAFQSQPVGGTSLAEANIEYRFPLKRAQGLGGVLFVDGAIVGANQFSNVNGSTGAITPGFGIRFNTPVGPVRLDLGIRPKLVEKLPVITSVSDSTVTGRLIILKTPRLYNPLDVPGGWYKKLTNRLMVHLAIGPAF